MASASLLSLAVLLASLIPARTISVTLSAHWASTEEEQPADEQLRVRLTPATSPAEPQDPIAFDLALPSERTLDLPAGSVWRLTASAPGLWLRSFVFAVGNEPSLQTLRAYETGRIAGKVALAPGEGKPQELALRFQSPPGETEFGVESTSCPVTDDGSFRCELPRGKLDLRLGLRGFAPHYLWGVTLSKGTTTNLGTLRFLPGASLSGTVVAEPPLPPSTTVTVELRPSTVPSATGQAPDERIHRWQRTAQLDERGHFQLTELAPGEYRVVARATGYVDGDSGPVEIFAGVESVLDQPVTLHPPARLEVALHPPVDPYGEPWRLLLLSAKEPHHEPDSYRGVAGEDGTWTLENVAEGPYRLSVRSSSAEWLVEDVDVRTDAPAVEIEVPLVPVVGTVHWHGEPRDVALWFVEVGTQKRSRFELVDEDFSGYLPYEGPWQVVLFDRTTRQRHVLEPVDVQISKASGVARVDLEVPDGEIHGQVVDPEGKPVSGVEVEAQLSGLRVASSTTRTGPDGHFSFSLLSPGAYLLAASHPDYTMASAQVQLQESLLPPEVVLRLRRMQPLRITVSASGLPVPGSWVLLVPVASGSVMGELPNGSTNAQGYVDLAIPDNTVSLNALIFPPGFAAKVLHIDPSRKQFQADVSGSGGSLTLELPVQEQGLSYRGEFLILHDGAFAALSDFRSWSRARGTWNPAEGRVTIPMLEVGEYTVCPPGPPPADSEAAGSRCQTGFVPPAGELVLSLR